MTQVMTEEHENTGLTFTLPFMTGVGTLLNQQNQNDILNNNEEYKALLKSQVKQVLEEELLRLVEDDRYFDQHFDNQFERAYKMTEFMVKGDMQGLNKFVSPPAPPS